MMNIVELAEKIFPLVEETYKDIDFNNFGETEYESDVWYDRALEFLHLYDENVRTHNEIEIFYNIIHNKLIDNYHGSRIEQND